MLVKERKNPNAEREGERGAGERESERGKRRRRRRNKKKLSADPKLTLSDTVRNSSLLFIFPFFFPSFGS